MPKRTAWICSGRANHAPRERVARARGLRSQSLSWNRQAVEDEIEARLEPIVNGYAGKCGHGAHKHLAWRCDIRLRRGRSPRLERPDELLVAPRSAFQRRHEPILDASMPLRTKDRRHVNPP